MLTNELQLPAPLVTALEHDTYERGESEYTVTELIAPPRIVALKRKHGEQIVEDASDKIFTLFGKAIHTILEKAASERYLVEQRFYAEHDGVKIGGQIDLYDKELKELTDWKICSRWVVADGIKPEWIEQQNLNRYILWKNQIEVRSCKNICIFRDWSKPSAETKADYPPRQVHVAEIPLWTKEQVHNYLSERIALHREASVKLPECTPRERWVKPARWALMKRGQKRAIKLYDEEDQANGALKNAGNGQYFIEERPGSSVRCVWYCPVLPFCTQGREIVQNEIQAK